MQFTHYDPVALTARSHPPSISSSSRAVTPTSAPRPGPSNRHQLTGNSQRRLTKVLAHIAHLRKLDQDSIEKRREKRHAYRHKDKEKEEDSKVEVAQACLTCRKAKTKCLNRDGEPCARCTMAGERCTYPPQKKRGRRADTSLQDVLDQVENEITTLLLAGPDDDAPVERTIIPQPADLDEEKHTALQNPLGMLATAAIDQSVEENVRGPAKYWNSIYAVKSESDFTQDPVVMGLISEDDLSRLVYFFMTNLRPFFMHLDPVIHTPAFLRLNSPFLTSAIASVASTYDQHSHHLAAPLALHARNLASKAFAEGCKSLEVVQAYQVLLFWIGRFPPYWSEDRSWSDQGTSIRIATEIRLDLPPNKDTLTSYRFTRGLTEDEANRLLACRKRTYLLVSLSEISMASQTGRADTTSGHRLFRSPEMPFLAPDDPSNDRFKGAILLTHIFAKALHLWHSADKDDAHTRERDHFLAGWRRDLDDWTKKTGDQDPLLEILSTNSNIMLILLTLRIRGSHASTLELLRQIRDLAAHLIASVYNWYQQGDFFGPGGLAYAHDFLVVNIAYAALSIYKLSHDSQITSAEDANLHINNALQVLDTIASSRFACMSTAALLAAQIRRLCQISNPPRIDPTLTSTTSNSNSANNVYSGHGHVATNPNSTGIASGHPHSTMTTGLNDLSFFGQSPARHFEFDFSLPTLPPFDGTDPFFDLIPQ